VLALALVLVLTATVAPLALASPSSAAAPQPTDLAYAAPTAGERTPGLTWSRVPGATRYTVQGSASASFSPLLFNQDTTNATYVPTGVLPAGPLYWRVQAYDASGASGYVQAGPGAVPTVAALPVPEAVTVVPAGTGPIVPPTAPPVISWEGVAGATAYDVEVDDNGDQVGGTVKSSVKTTTLVWPDPQGVGERSGIEDFFVRVRARFPDSRLSEWTAYTRYEVAQLPPVTSSATTCPAELSCILPPLATTPTTPRPVTTVEDVVFAWDPVPGAQRYEIWVSKVSDFSDSPVEKKVVSGTRFSPTTTFDNGSYFWQVRALNAAGTATPWPMVPSEFRRRWPTSPDLVHPADSASVPVTDDLYFQWTPVQHATRYSLEVATDPNFSPESVNRCTTAQTTFTVGYRTDSCSGPLGNPIRLRQGDIYYWRVRALDAPKGVWSIYSPARRMVYDLGAPTPVAPGNGATVSVPTLRWRASGRTPLQTTPTVKSAHRYLVILRDNSDTEVDRVTTAALSWTTTKVLDPAKSPYSWSVQVVGGKSSDISPLYGWQTFSYESPQPAAAPLAANAPVYGDSTARVPSLSWQPVVGADHYRLVVMNSAGFVLAPGADAALTADLHHPAVTPWEDYFWTRPGTYTFWAVAYDENNVEVATTAPGERGTFTIGVLTAVTGQRLALDGQALDDGRACDLRWASATPTANVCAPTTATPVFDWDPVPGAGGYMLYIYLESDVTTPVYDPLDTTTESTRWTPDAAVRQAIADNTTSTGAYFWFVRPCVRVRPTFGGCGPDPASSLDAATNAFRKLSPAPEPIRPAAGSSVADEVTFTWQDYRDTSSRSALPAEPSAPGWDADFPQGSPASHQSAMTYRVQVSKSAEMTDANAIDDETVDQTSYTSFAGTYPEGDLWWRVQAIDAAGNRLQWSTPTKFRKDSPAPLRRTAQTSRDVLLSWSARPSDSTWDVEVYANADTTASPANKVASGSALRQSAFTPTTPLPTASESYVWRARRTDTSGEQGKWSDWGSFDVMPQNPAAGATCDGTTLLQPDAVCLTWPAWTSDGRRATRYAVDVRNGAGQSVGSTSSTAATTWAPTVNLAGGTYTWRVTAYDTADNPVATYAPATFVVDTVLTPSSPPQVLVSAQGAEVGASLNVQMPTWNRPTVTTTVQWLRDGSTIGGATGTSYQLGTADVNRTLSVRVTARKPGYTEQSVVSQGVSVAPGRAPTPTRLPSLGGTAAVKQTLSTDGGEWPSGSQLTFQWFVNGQAVARETRSTYVVRGRDAGLPVFVRVIASRTGFVAGSADSAAAVVAPMATSLTAKADKTKLIQRDRPSLQVAVSVPDFDTALGQVQVREGSKVLASVPLASGKNGSLTIRLKKLTKGKHKLTISYTGSASTLPASGSVTLKVVAKKKR
jgi:hypothetical protein